MNKNNLPILLLTIATAYLPVCFAADLPEADYERTIKLSLRESQMREEEERQEKRAIEESIHDEKMRQQKANLMNQALDQRMTSKVAAIDDKIDKIKNTLMNLAQEDKTNRLRKTELESIASSGLDEPSLMLFVYPPLREIKNLIRKYQEDFKGFEADLLGLEKEKGELMSIGKAQENVTVFDRKVVTLIG